MELKIAKNIPVALALAATSVAFGAMSTNERVAQLEQEMQCVYLNSINDTCGAQTALARPMVKGDCRCGMGWFAEFDILYWHSYIGGTEFAYTDNSPALIPGMTDGTGFPVKGRTKDVDMDMEWGFKAALGYNFEHDGWDSRLRYTRFHTNDSSSTSAGLNSTVVPLRGAASLTNGSGAGPQPTGTFQFCSSAKSNVELDYDRLDLDLGRSFFVSKYLAMRPSIGLTGAWFDIDQNTTYTGGTASGDSLGLGVNSVHVKDSSDFSGIGPKAEIETKWYLGNHFSIYGNVTGALVYGHFDVTHSERYSLLSGNKIKLDGSQNRFSPNAVYELGLSYDTYVNDNQQHISVFIGYEVQQWFRLNQSLEINDYQVLKYNRYSEDVSYQGVTFGARLDF